MTSILLAIKVHDDIYYDNLHYSRIGGISCHELNEIEKEFCQLLSYNFYVETDEYLKYAEDIRLYALSKPGILSAQK